MNADILRKADDRVLERKGIFSRGSEAGPLLGADVMKLPQCQKPAGLPNRGRLSLPQKQFHILQQVFLVSQVARVSSGFCRNFQQQLYFHILRFQSYKIESQIRRLCGDTVLFDQTAVSLKLKTRYFPERPVQETNIP